MHLPKSLVIVAALLIALHPEVPAHFARADLPVPAAVEREAAPPGPGEETRPVLGGVVRPSTWWQRTRVWQLSLRTARAAPMQLPLGGHLSRGYKPSEWHYGLDIASRRFAPIVSARAGEVVFSGWDDSGYGRMVLIDHGDGVRTLYGHLQALLVKKGQRVPAGYLIGLCGSSGHAYGTHLHFEISKEGVKLDPLAFYLERVE
jgi:murein DD-endopeptidase MepM/ murein hydrolase activator NlpD